jgi:YhgE/Pip-like protein
VEGVADVLRRPLAWGAVLLAGALGVIMTFSYLGGFLDPIHHLRGLRVGIVNEDSPVDVAGIHVDAGRRVVHGVQTAGRREVTFIVYPSRAAALQAIHDDHLIGAVDVRPGFSQAIANVGTSGGADPQARLHMISNDGAGLFQAQVFAKVLAEVDQQVNETANRQIVDVLSGFKIKVDPAGAAHIARPVRIVTVDEVSVTGKTGRGLAPFYTALMVTLSGFLACSVASLVVDVLRGSNHLEVFGDELEVEVEVRNDRPLEAWATKAILAMCGAVLAALGVTVVGVQVLGMHTSSFWGFFGVAALGASAIALITLVFLTLFGIGGELLGVLFTTIFGVPSALGVYPAEALPPFFRFVSTWHPMHYLTDAFRALIFYDGRADAGLSRAVGVLVAWWVAALVVGFGSALLIDRRGGAKLGDGLRVLRTPSHLPRVPARGVPAGADH